MKKYRMLFFVTIIFLLILPGCGNQLETGSMDNESGSEDMFTDRDLETGYDENNAALITLNGSTAECSSDAVQISGSDITITDEGTYILSGTLDDGMVIIDAKEDDKLQLVLSDAVINSASSAAIYVKEADKVFITTVSGTDNVLSNGGEYIAIDDNNIDSVIFSKSDLTLNGTGSLDLNAVAGHGVVSKDDLVIIGGSYSITSAGHGISANDSVRIAGGTFSVVSGKDGIQAENSDDPALGFVYIENGTFEITAEGDGISAGAYLQIYNGTYTLVTGGGAGNESSVTDDSVSTKGLKAADSLILYGGTFHIDSLDDAIHSNGDVTVKGGSYQMASGDDGIHADAALTITGGSILITQSYEGLEGLTIDISGGEITLTASDDGLNAAGGKDQSGFGGGRGDQFAAQSGVYINISGGVIHVNASGDGIDSNGDLTVSGGETYISGPVSGADGALDYNGEAVISGGIFVAAGALGMEQNFGSSSTQGSMLVSVDPQEAGSTISLTDSDGNELVSWQPDKAYKSVVISCPDIVQGADYILTAGSYSASITTDALIYGTGGMGEPGGMEGFGGRENRGGIGDRDGMSGPRGDMEEPDNEMERPDDGNMKKPDGDMEGFDGKMGKPGKDMQEMPEGMEKPE